MLEMRSDGFSLWAGGFFPPSQGWIFPSIHQEGAGECGNHRQAESSCMDVPCAFRRQGIGLEPAERDTQGRLMHGIESWNGLGWEGP